MRSILILFACAVTSQAFAQSIVISGGRGSIVVSGHGVLADKPSSDTVSEIDRLKYENDFLKSSLKTATEKPVITEQPKRKTLRLEYWGASWCGNCPAMKAASKRAAKALGVELREYDFDRHANWRSRARVDRVPVLSIIEDDVQVDRLVGAYPKEAIIERVHSVSSVVPSRSPVTVFVPDQTVISPGRYYTYGGRQYDLENYGGCSMRSCGMCAEIRAAAQRYRASRQLINDIGPQAPTPDDVIDEALDLLDLKPDSVFAELGCGDGRVIVRAIQRCEKNYGSRCRAIGIEIDPLKVAEARRVILDHGLSDWATILQGDVKEFSPSRHSVTHVYAYLYPELLQEISDILTSVEISVCPGHECLGIGQQLIGQCWVYRKA